MKPKTPNRILSDMIATVRAETSINPDPRQRISDFTRGSVARSLLEAASLQDADQYLQILALKRMFSIETAEGEELVDRGIDYDTEPYSPEPSRGYVRIGDERSSGRATSTLSGAVAQGASTLTLTNASAFPPSGALVLGRGSAHRELVSYSSKDGNTLTLTEPTLFSHDEGSRVFLSLYGSDLVVQENALVTAPFSNVTFRLLESATLLDGDEASEEVLAVAVTPGDHTNVGSGQIRSFVSRPWPTATVTNERSFTGGRDEEDIEDFRDRLRTIRQARNAVSLELEQAALAVQTDTKRVVSARVSEEADGSGCRLYIDDGHGTAAEVGQRDSFEILIHNAETGQRRARVSNWPLLPDTLRLCVSQWRGSGQTSTRGTGTATIHDSNLGLAANILAGKYLVDGQQNIYRVQTNTATTIVVLCGEGEPLPYPFAWAVFDPTSPTSGYVLNETTGDFELTQPLVAGDVVVAAPSTTLPAYSYYTGLIREVQRVINGDRTDRERYPGVKASGVVVRVLAASRREVTVAVAIVAEFGVSEATLAPQVRSAIETYVNGLGVGENIILAKIIDVAMDIPGVADVKVISPRSNVVILEGQKARTSGNLISVT